MSDVLGVFNPQALWPRVYEAAGHDLWRRMRNWACVDAGADTSAQSSLCLLGTVGSDRYRELQVPYDSAEAAETSKALELVPARNRQAVYLFWTHYGDTLNAHGMRRRVDYRIFERWLIEGHNQLKAEIYKRAAMHASRFKAARANIS